MWRASPVLIILCVAAMPACAETGKNSTNPFFGKSQNQVALNIGQGFDYGWLVAPPLRPVPYYTAHFQYSQPATFFKIPARQSLNASMNLGLAKDNGWDWRDFSVPIIYWSGDAALLYGKKWYSGAGIGGGFQMDENERIGSKLLFQFKLFAGYKITERYTAELFMQHFSNGATAENNSYLFWGLGMTYNF